MPKIKDHPSYSGWYIKEGILYPYDESVGGPRRHANYKGGFQTGIHFGWDERNGILYFSEAGRCFDAHGHGTISANTIEEVEFLISKFLTISA